ncbi:MAG: AI-2E family transporter [Lysobacterales bacterium]
MTTQQTASVPLPAASAEHPTRNRLLAGILALLVLHACAVAEAVIVPLLLALLISLMLAPSVRWLCRWRLPRPLSVVVVMLVTLLLSSALIGGLIGPARSWAAQAPKSIARMEMAVSGLRSPLREASKASEQIDKLTDLDSGGRRTQKTQDVEPSRLTQMLKATPGALTSVVLTLLLILIFLLHGEKLLRKLVELAPALRLKKEIVLATRSAQHELSRYIISITTINAMLGGLAALALWALGVDNPLLWGGVAAILNFVPFVGPMVTAALLVVAGFAQFATPLAALCVPGVFLALNTIEGQLLTPLVVGRRLALDPVMVFLALMLFGWLWGVAGLLMALPLLTCLRIVAQRWPGSNTLARLLGE